MQQRNILGHNFIHYQNFRCIPTAQLHPRGAVDFLLVDTLFHVRGCLLVDTLFHVPYACESSTHTQHAVYVLMIHMRMICKQGSKRKRNSGSYAMVSAHKTFLIRTYLLRELQQSMHRVGSLDAVLP